MKKGKRKQRKIDCQRENRKGKREEKLKRRTEIKRRRKVTMKGRESEYITLDGQN